MATTKRKKTDTQAVAADKTVFGHAVLADALQDAGDTEGADDARREARVLGLILQGLTFQRSWVKGHSPTHWLDVAGETAIEVRVHKLTTDFMFVYNGMEIFKIGRRRRPGASVDGDAQTANTARCTVRGLKRLLAGHLERDEPWRASHVQGILADLLVPVATE